MMNTGNRIVNASGRWATTLFAGLILAGCSDSSGLSPNALNGQTLTRGLVTDAGSLTVNDRPFSFDGASIVVNGQSSSSTSLREGMVVTVESSSGSALAVDYEETVKGPLDALNPDGTLSVMGQIVLLSDATNLANGSAGTFSAGDVLEVSGIRDANQQIHASFLERKSALPNAFSVRGPISNLDRAAMTFTLGNLTVHYSASTFDDISEQSLRNNLLIEVKNQLPEYEPGSLFLNATKIERDSTALSAGTPVVSQSVNDLSNDYELEVEGFITEIVADDLFRMNALLVRIGENTQFKDGPRSSLGLNSRVEVEGRLNSAGELVAWEIEFDDDSGFEDFDDDSSFSSNSDSDDDDDGTEVEIEGVVTDIDRINFSFTLNGIRIQTAGNTEFENASDQYVTRSAFFDLLQDGITVVKVEWRPFISYEQAPREVEIED